MIKLSIISTFISLMGLIGMTHGAAEVVPVAQLSQFKLGETITGPAITLEQAAGKAVLIDAWGIHCGPCLASLPELEKIAKRYKDKLVVFGAHCQGGSDAEVIAVTQKNRLSYTITKGVTSPIAFNGIPRVFVFDRQGGLVFTGSPFDQRFQQSLQKATSGGASGGLSGGLPARPSALDAFKNPKL